MAVLKINKSFNIYISILKFKLASFGEKFFLMPANGGGMRSCRLRENSLSSYTDVDAGDELANCATPGSFLYHVLYLVVFN
jgi:hypothetical protein